jgi:predicted phosphodiesterase
MSKWHTRAIELRKSGLSYGAIAAEVGRSYYTVRDVFRALKIEKGTPVPAVEVKAELTDEELLKALKTGLPTAPELVMRLQDLARKGYQFTYLNDVVKLSTSVAPVIHKSVAAWDGQQTLRFGVVSDTHLGSTHQQLSFLQEAYQRFKAHGITTVYHPGDISEGSGMRKGQEFEIFVHGADAQVRYIAENYPRVPGITTKFITGNHDLSQLKNAGHDIGYALAEKRDDLEYLGQERARIQLTPNCIFEMVHPRDGASYAISYSTQKFIDAMSGGEKPNILFIGHHHKALYLFYRNIHAFEAGCLQAQTGFMRGKRLSAHVGYWILEVDVNKDGSITRLKQEFFPQYKSIENDY